VTGIRGLTGKLNKRPKNDRTTETWDDGKTGQGPKDEKTESLRAYEMNRSRKNYE
jgi:hypothetical protein